MGEVANLGRYEHYVCGCLDVVDSLVRHGCVTQVEERRAKAFFALQEVPWPQVTPVEPGSRLYFDGLALAYFQHLGFSRSSKGRDSPSNFRSEVSEADRLLGAEALAARAGAVLDGISCRSRRRHC